MSNDPTVITGPRLIPTPTRTPSSPNLAKVVTTPMKTKISPMPDYGTKRK